ncbi:MAG: MFS transporter [Candidatus Doudnabacteria bacterium]|nr:MFS transporter [Candidatus Doudnabacteria bacterium]
MQGSKYLSVLKNINFTKLWISQATSQLTNYILSFAILIKVFKLTNSSLSVSLIIMAFGLATVFFGSLAGVYADRFDRRWLLTTINFLQAGSIALYFLVGSDFWGLVLITFVYSSLNQFYIPAEAPSIPSLVPHDQILVANSYFAFTNSAALIIGFAGAGPISSAFGNAAPYWAGVILLTIAGLATLSLPSLPPRVEHENKYSLAKVWHEFKEGVHHFWNNKLLHYPLLALIYIQIVNGMLITIAPAFMKEAIGINLDTGSILVVAPLGIGILIGALTLGFEERYFSKRGLIVTGFFGMGVALFLLSFIEHFSQRFFYYSALGLFMGYFNAHIFAPSHSILQTNAHSDLRGRIYATLYVLLQVAATLPTVVIGLLADKMPITYIVTILGSMLVAFGLIIRPKNTTT